MAGSATPGDAGSFECLRPPAAATPDDLCHRIHRQPIRQRLQHHRTRTPANSSRLHAISQSYAQTLSAGTSPTSSTEGMNQSHSTGNGVLHSHSFTTLLRTQSQQVSRLVPGLLLSLDPQTGPGNGVQTPTTACRLSQPRQHLSARLALRRRATISPRHAPKTRAVARSGSKR